MQLFDEVRAQIGVRYPNDGRSLPSLLPASKLQDSA